MKFGLIGAGGYVAPRHMQAIKDTGHELVVALDPNDSVGILDKYFPDCKFFKDEHRFDRHCVKHEELDYVVVCSPNYLHEAHCKLGMRLGANVICEKPLTTTLGNLIQLRKIEKQTNRRVFSILQLRLHPSIKLLKHMIDKDKKYLVHLSYVTPRGPWYFQSWKGKEGQSGGIETNIGIHFFDVLLWLFGPLEKCEVTVRNEKLSAGIMELKNANVEWFLSLNKDDLPEGVENFYRRMNVDGEDIIFDNVFTDLHTESYREILAGRGYGIDDSMDSIRLVQHIRNGLL